MAGRLSGVKKWGGYRRRRDRGGSGVVGAATDRPGPGRGGPPCRAARRWPGRVSAGPGTRMSCPVPAACRTGRGCVPGAAAPCRTAGSGAAAPGRSGTRAWRASRGRPPDGCGHGRNRSRTWTDPSPRSRCPGRPVPGGPPAAAAPHDGHHRVPSGREVGDPREPLSPAFPVCLPASGHVHLEVEVRVVGRQAVVSPGPLDGAGLPVAPLPCLSGFAGPGPAGSGPWPPGLPPGMKGGSLSSMACRSARWTTARPRRRSPSCAGAPGAGPRRAVPPRSARSRFPSSRPPCGSAPAPAAAPPRCRDGRPPPREPDDGMSPSRRGAPCRSGCGSWHCGRNGTRRRRRRPADGRRTPSTPRHLSAPQRRVDAREAAAEVPGVDFVQPLAHPGVRRRPPHAGQRAEVPRHHRITAARTCRPDCGGDGVLDANTAGPASGSRKGRCHACRSGRRCGGGMRGPPAACRASTDAFAGNPWTFSCPAFACLAAGWPIRRGKSTKRNSRRPRNGLIMKERNCWRTGLTIS